MSAPVSADVCNLDGKWSELSPIGLGAQRVGRA
jgi:hypothetical protein